MQNETRLEFKSRDWAKIDHKKIDMFAVKMQQEGGFNIKSFNKVSRVPLLPPQTVVRSAFKKYQ